MPLEAKLHDVAHQRDHDLRLGTDALLGDDQRRLDDRPDLHGGNFRVDDAKPAAAKAQHGVEFVQRRDGGLDNLHGDAHRRGHLVLVVFLLGEELVQGRIQKADGHRTGSHHAEDTLEVTPLKRQQLAEGLVVLGFRPGQAALDVLGLGPVLAGGGQLTPQALDILGHQDEPPEADDAVALEEHVLGAAESDALGAHLGGAVGVAGDVGVGSHAKPADRVGPLHQLVVLAEQKAFLAGEHAVLHLDDFGGLDLDLPDIHRAGETRQADILTFADDLGADGDGLGVVVDPQFARAGDAWGAHAAGHDGGVTGHPAAGGQHRLRHGHPTDILW